jgi:hypothetical protein
MSESLNPNSKGKGRGGARAGAGRPKGKMEPQTIAKMAAKKAFEERVAKNAEMLFNAQISLAIGTQMLIKKVKHANGSWSKFAVVDDPEEIINYLNGAYKGSADVYHQITIDKPDSRAIDSLLDRSFGKAAQSLTVKDDRPDPIALILKGFGLLPDDDEDGDDDAGEAETTTS